MACLIPAVEFADDVYCHRMGRPDCEMHALLSLMLRQMRAQLSENIIVIALSEQILVKIADEAGYLRLLCRCCPGFCCLYCSYFLRFISLCGSLRRLFCLSYLGVRRVLLPFIISPLFNYK